MPRWKTDAPVAITSLDSTLFTITTTFKAGSQGIKHLHAYYLVLPEMRLLFHGPDRVDFYKQHDAFFAEHGGMSATSCCPTRPRARTRLRSASARASARRS